MKFKLKNSLQFAIGSVIAASASQAYAVSALLEEVVVTATKKAEGVAVQEVPVAVTAFGAEQLEVLKVRDLKGLTYSMPNVQLDDVGTAKGVANFSIRGLGVNSSIPTIDPTVGTFIDGIYLGINYGVVLDQFDIAGIEVLRGPQGLLFGRNVTGGAVLVKTTKPTEELSGNVKASYESGDNKYISGVVTGPLIEDKLLGKIAAYYNDDDGYFENDFNGDDFGESETEIIRLGLTYLINDSNELTLRYEHGELDGDGPAAQDTTRFDRDDDNFAINEEGFSNAEWDHFSAELISQIGDGTLTTIFGWREIENETLIDLDASIAPAFTAATALEAEQSSLEIRYNIVLDDWIDITTGLYYFTQDTDYLEERALSPTAFQQPPFNFPAGGLFTFPDATSNGGGFQEQDTYGAFLSIDWRLNDQVTLITGVRYTYEEKEVDLVRQRPIISMTGGLQPCDLSSLTCSFIDFSDDDDWNNVTPKIAVQWFVNDDTQLYASYSKGFRSGGYNVRNTDSRFPLEVFDEEEQDSFEVGIKLDALDNRLRFNAAVFYNTIDDIQRDINTPSPESVIAQTTRNTADVEILGVEAELTFALTDNLVLGANFGHIDAEYDEVRFDLNEDGVVDSGDEGLDLPRSPINTTGGVNLTWESDINEDFSLVARVGYSRRDVSFFTDNNRGVLNAVDIYNATVSVSTLDGALTFSLFGKNLTDEISHGGDTPAGNPTLFSFAPLNKGRVYGGEVAYKF